jgi:hypothetical protein
LSGRLPIQSHVELIEIVSLPPLGGSQLNFFNSVKHRWIEQLITHRAVKSLYIEEQLMFKPDNINPT